MRLDGDLVDIGDESALIARRKGTGLVTRELSSEGGKEKTSGKKTEKKVLIYRNKEGLRTTMQYQVDAWTGSCCAASASEAIYAAADDESALMPGSEDRKSSQPAS